MQPYRKRQWCISVITSELLARLKIIIRIYLLPYSELRPVLSKEVLTYFKQRSDLGIKINWQFSCQMVREKLNSHYVKVNSDNIKYQKTY